MLNYYLSSKPIKKFKSGDLNHIEESKNIIKF
jgi:hypothetical protein